MNKELFKKRREKLTAFLEDNNMILLFAASERGLSFQQNKNFYYLTGLEIPEAVLMVTKRKGSLIFRLYIERTIEAMIVWDGEKMSKERASEISGIDNVFYLDELDRGLTGELFTTEKLFLEIEPHSVSLPLNKQMFYAKQIRGRYPQTCVASYNRIAAKLRQTKDEWEISRIQKGIEITGKGLSRVFSEAREGMMEYELEAMLNYELLRNGLRNWGYKPIVAGGKNAVTLHYCRNNMKIEKDSLVLIDTGALCDNYSADITRTFPIGTGFTARQKEIYQEVLKVEESIISMVEPGISIKELNAKTVDLLSESLLKLKLIEKKEEYKKYYMHSVSHFLGMDAHDVSLYMADSILEPGNVITVEPGLYIEEEGIGVRIEDDILVTERGYKNLSEGIPKQVAELEEIRRKGLERS